MATAAAARRDIPRILIVDDVEANRFILKDVIADMGYCPILAENGIQALKMIQHIKPQLIVLDIASEDLSTSAMPLTTWKKILRIKTIMFL